MCDPQFYEIIPYFKSYICKIIFTPMKAAIRLPLSFNVEKCLEIQIHCFHPYLIFPRKKTFNLKFPVQFIHF